MQVGTTNASPMTVSGYAGYAQEQLASTFARLASTESFRQQTVQAAGLPSSALVSANASPQPQQPFVRVTVRATSPAAARTLLVAAEKVLAQRVRSYATRGGRPKALRRAVRAQAKLTAAEAREQTGPSIGAQAVANQAAVSAAQLRVTVTDKALGADAGITPSVVLLTSPTIHSPGIIAVGRRSWLPPVTLAAVAIGLILSTLVLLAPTLVARRSTS
jgi:hypothetical protein